MWTTYTPQHPLSDFVNCFWSFEGPPASHARERLLPSAEMELVINLREDRVRLYNRENYAQAATFRGQVIVGPQTEYFVIDTDEQQSVLGIHFRPGGAFPFFPLPCGELRDQHVGLDCLWGNLAGELRERLLEAATCSERFGVLEGFLLSRVKRPLTRHRAVSFALQEFRRAQSIGEIVDRIGLSQRRFIEAFSAEVGLTPKLYCRVRRFQELLRRIQGMREVDWTGTALDCGYFDQAHFNHDFRGFTGMSPSAYLATNRRNMNHVPILD
jgi:AraC-like DNA-binding protein